MLISLSTGRGNGATSQDVVQLVNNVLEGVKAATGIELEPELLFLGKTWK